MSRPKHAVVIGRFQPFHLGHLKLITKSLDIGQNICIVLGSAQTAPDVKNPFTPEKREEMIRACFDEKTNARLFFVSVRDYTYNLNMWLTEVRTKVLTALDCEDHEIALTGHFKDETSFYLKMFPNWKFEELFNHTTLAATNIRELLFQGKIDEIKALVPTPVLEKLTEFTGTLEYSILKKEFDYITDYKSQWKGPFTPHFVTVDAVVIQSGHILVVKRGRHPGKGLLALPGGFLKEGKTLRQTMLTELKEETRILVPSSILNSCIVDKEIFDSPDRSLRGRTVTTAFLIRLPDNLEKGLPKVQGDDDAEKAFWMPLGDVLKQEDAFFEDHIHIIRYFTNKL